MPSDVDTIRCVRARLSLSLALDGEAAGSDLLLTALHLGRCGSCRDYAAQVGAITAELRAHGRGSRKQRAMDYQRGAGS
jgi:predicted anti-sigma-YlaC factor YlaD